MNKQQFFETLQKALTLTQQEFQEAWNEKEQELAGQDLTPEQKELFVINKLYAHYSKMLRVPAKTYEAVVLGVSNATDFGATNTYNRLKTGWDNASPEVRKMFAEHGAEYDKDGNPLWGAGNTKNTRKYQNPDGTLKSLGLRRIKLEYEKQKQVLMYGKDEESQQSKLIVLTLQ